MNTNDAIDEYFKLADLIHEAFGYQEDHVVIPMEDARDFYWTLSGEGSGDNVRFSEHAELLEDEEAGEYYSNEIYTQCFLPKYVYRADEFTMISVDTHTDGNCFLQIFDNAKEITDTK